MACMKIAAMIAAFKAAIPNGDYHGEDAQVYEPDVIKRKRQLRLSTVGRASYSFVTEKNKQLQP